MAVDAHPQGQFRFGRVQASHDAVDAKPLLVPIVGGGEEGGVATVGVEFGHHPGGGLVGERGRRSRLRRDYQPVGVAVPPDGEEPLGVRRSQEPGQADLEDVGRYGAVGQRQLLGHGRQARTSAGAMRSRAVRWALSDWT